MKNLARKRTRDKSFARAPKKKVPGAAWDFGAFFGESLGGLKTSRPRDSLFCGDCFLLFFFFRSFFLGAPARLLIFLLQL
jgi:hypothetical protein